MPSHAYKCVPGTLAWHLGSCAVYLLSPWVAICWPPVLVLLAPAGILYMVWVITPIGSGFPRSPSCKGWIRPSDQVCWTPPLELLPLYLAMFLHWLKEQVVLLKRLRQEVAKYKDRLGHLTRPYLKNK